MSTQATTRLLCSAAVLALSWAGTVGAADAPAAAASAPPARASASPADMPAAGPSRPLVSPAAPASPSAPSVAASHHGAAPAATYLAQRGDTLDTIIKKTMADSPLRVELLRQAFVQANPHAFPGGKPGRLPPGVVLHVPDHVQLVRGVLLPLLQPGEAYLGGTASASTEERRRWVRFP